MKMPSTKHAALALSLLVSLLCGSPFLAKAESRCARLISLAPSVTELVSELGIAGQLVGISRYDKDTPVLSKLPRVGGLMDINLEVIVSLRPSLVIGLSEQDSDLEKLKQLGLKTLMINHKAISGIIESVREVGEACGAGASATSMVQTMEAALKEYGAKAEALPKQRALVLIGDAGAKRLRDLFLSGNDGYFSGALALLGANNIYGKRTGGVATVSLETIMSLNPQVIFIVASNVDGLEIDKAGILKDLKEFPEINAVREGAIFFLEHDYAYTPGPRFPLLLDELLLDLQKAAKL